MLCWRVVLLGVGVLGICGSVNAEPGSAPTAVDGTSEQGDPDATSVSPEPDRSLELFLSVLREPQIETLQRREAALALLETGGVHALEPLLDEMGPRGDPAIQHIIAMALAVLPGNPPEEFLSPLFEMLERSDDSVLADVAAALGRYKNRKTVRQLVAMAEDNQAEIMHRRGAILALGHHRERSVVGSLIRLVQPDQAPPVREAGFIALANLTGIDEYGSDARRWEFWWTRNKELTGEYWLSMIIENFARHNTQMRAQTRRTLDRLTETQRQLYRSLPQAERPKILIGMLADPLDSTRNLAMDLVLQRLIDAQPVGPELRAALADQLESDSSAIRQRAARLLHDLADEAAAETVAQRLAKGGEHDPAVLRAYLQIMARLPRQPAVDRSLALLADPDLSEQAAAFLVAAADTGLLSPDQTRQATARLRVRLREDRPPDAPSLRLLGRFGDDEDWRRIEAWLGSKDLAVRQAAAETWAESDRPLTALASHAGDPVIQPIVIAAARRRGADSAVLTALIEHRPEDDQAIEAWQRALVAMASRVPAEAILTADALLRERSDVLELREQLLSVAIDRAAPNGVNGTTPHDPKTSDPKAPDHRDEPDAPRRLDNGALLIELLLARADARIHNAKPTLAIADYERISSTEQPLTQEQHRRHHLGLTRASLAAGQIDQAFSAAQLLRQADWPGEQRDEVVEMTIGIFLDTAQRNLEADQHEQTTGLLKKIREMVGETIPTEIEPRLSELEQRAQAALKAGPATDITPDSASAPTPLSGPASSMTPDHTAESVVVEANATPVDEAQ